MREFASGAIQNEIVGGRKIINFLIRLFKTLACLFVLCQPTTFGADTHDHSASTQPHTASAALSVKYIISEPCSLVCFIDILSQPRNKMWLKDWFDRRCQSSLSSSAFQLKEKDLLANYKELLDRNSNQDAFTDSTGRRLSLDNKLISLASETGELSEFLTKLKSCVGAEDYLLLEKTFSYFEKPYREILWEPRLTLLREQLDEFEKESIKLKLIERLTTVLNFMRSSWNPDLPFTLVLVPLPEPPSNKKSTSGTSLGAVQIVELLPETKFRNKGDVVFHELCHALWYSKPDHSKFETEFQLPNMGALPMTELYEGMATAVGQGWFAKEAFGHSLKIWYGDKIIDRYAHLVAPLYASYLTEGKALDADFARRATKIYFENFPDAAMDIKSTSGLLVISQQEIQDLNQFRSELGRALPRSRELSFCNKIDSADSIDAFHSTSAVQIAALLAPSEIDKLKALEISDNQIAHLNTHQSGTTNLKVNGKHILVCIADTVTAQEQLLLSVVKRSKWPALHSTRVGAR